MNVNKNTFNNQRQYDLKYDLKCKTKDDAHVKQLRLWFSNQVPVLLFMMNAAWTATWNCHVNFLNSTNAVSQLLFLTLWLPSSLHSEHLPDFQFVWLLVRLHLISSRLYLWPLSCFLHGLFQQLVSDSFFLHVNLLLRRWRLVFTLWFVNKVVHQRWIITGDDEQSHEDEGDDGLWTHFIHLFCLWYCWQTLKCFLTWRRSSAVQSEALFCLLVWLDSCWLGIMTSCCRLSWNFMTSAPAEVSCYFFLISSQIKVQTNKLKTVDGNKVLQRKRTAVALCLHVEFVRVEGLLTCCLKLPNKVRNESTESQSELKSTWTLVNPAASSFQVSDCGISSPAALNAGWEITCNNNILFLWALNSNIQQMTEETCSSRKINLCSSLHLIFPFSLFSSKS